MSESALVRLFLTQNFAGSAAAVFMPLPLIWIGFGQQLNSVVFAVFPD